MSSADSSRPNILLIIADQLRHDFIGAYQPDSSRFMKTPNLDALAKDGCLFERAYSPNPVCIPARSNLLTGLPARFHGFDDNYFGPSAKPMPWYLPTFPQILNDAGYHTAAIGKMHFQPDRRSTGFDLFLNQDEVVSDISEDDYALELREKGYRNIGSYHGVRNVLYMQPQESFLPEELHGSHWVADHCIEFLNDQTSSPKPFLLCAGFIHPHPPFDIPPSRAHLYDGKIPARWHTDTPLSKLAIENQTLADLPDEESINRMRELYACAISCVDFNVGRIIQALKDTGAYENTLILFLSDHGEMLGDLDTYQKFLPYEPSSHVPFILRWPGHFTGGMHDRRFIDLNDVLPTLLDAAGISYTGPYELPGCSLNRHTKDRRYQYIEHQHGCRRWCAILDDRYMFVHYYGDREQLFDLKNDAEETHDLLYGSVDPKAVEISNSLREVLLNYEEKWGLPGMVQNHQFIEEPTMEIHPYYEGCYPHTTIRYPGDAQMVDPLEDEILKAIANEPTVHLSRLHIHDRLIREAGFTEERYQKLMEKAKKINRF